MNEDVEVSFVKKSMDGILVGSRKLEVYNRGFAAKLITVYFLLSTVYLFIFPVPCCGSCRRQRP